MELRSTTRILLEHWVFVEFTRPMDSVTSSPEGDWVQKKELEKNARYGMHIYFINHLSALHGRPWNCTQANFTVGARGSLKQTQFQDRLCLHVQAWLSWSERGTVNP